MLVQSILLVSIVCNMQSVFAQLKLTIPKLNETFVAGSACNITWVPDPSGNWRNMTIDLLSNSKNNMSFVQNVVSGLDGTIGLHTPFSWTCPEVKPGSTAYLYQFTNGNDKATRTWTAQFTIIPSSNETESPKNTRRPNRGFVPWGIRLPVCRPPVTGSWGSAVTQNTRMIPRADKDRSNRSEVSGDGTYQAATKPRIHPANISAARSAAARASAIVHGHGPTSNHDFDFSSGLSGSGDPDSESQLSYLNSDDPDPGEGPSEVPNEKMGKGRNAPVMVSPPGHPTKSDASPSALRLFPVLFVSTCTMLAVAIT